MMHMWRRFDRLAVALAAVFVLVAGSTLPCLCAPMGPGDESAGSHGCCAQGPGLRAADETCCAGPHEREPEPWTPSAALALAGGIPLAVTAAIDAPRPLPAPLAPRRPVSAFPPLRI